MCLRVLDRGREQHADQLVLALWNREVDVPCGAAVQLCCSTGARAAATRQTLKADVQQPSVGEFVEVERDIGAWQAERLGSLIAADGVRLPDDIVVQTATRWLLESCHSGD